ncbi:hypothetical protein [Reyranella sp.]|uniref:hypothetical protein n=1 Tax=Reyranella sp. TaxID=1929291 RepID=UPI003BAC5966
MASLQLHARRLDDGRPQFAVLGEEFREAGASRRRHVEAEIVGPALLDLRLLHRLGERAFQPRQDRLGRAGRGTECFLGYFFSFQ